MVGDVNISLGEASDSDDIQAEVNIMIAEPIARRRGLSTHVIHFLIGKLKSLGIAKRILATINEYNSESISFFKKLGFAEKKKMACFQQIQFAFEL